MLTEQQRQQYQAALAGHEHKTNAELCRDLDVTPGRLTAILAELGVARPPRPPRRAITEIPRNTLEALVQEGQCKHQICRVLGISNRALLRLLRVHSLEVMNRDEHTRQLVAQGLRRCAQCKAIKTLETDFSNDRTDRYGKNPRCRECMKVTSAKYRDRWTGSARQAAAAERAASGPPTRRCRFCSEVKLLESEFDPDPKGPRWRSVDCRACATAHHERSALRQEMLRLEAEGLRRCYRCCEVKSLEIDFTVDRRDRTGRHALCKVCARARRQNEKLPIEHPAVNPPAPIAASPLPPLSVVPPPLAPFAPYSPPAAPSAAA